MNKRIIPIVLLLAACLAGLAFFALQREPGTPRNASAIPVPQRSASTTVPFTTYANAATGVSFLVPQSWEPAAGNPVRIASSDFVEEAVPGTDQKRVVAGAAVSLESEPFVIEDSAEYVELIKQVHESPECENCLTGHVIAIGGVPAYLGFASTGTSTEPAGAIISFVSGGNRYRLLMSFDSYTPLNREILAEIIHSFALAK